MPESPLRFADNPAIFDYLDGRNPGERQQITCTGLGVTIAVTVSEVTPQIPAMQIE